MRSKIARLGVLAVGLLALLGTTAPPAQAITSFQAEFVGTAQLAAGLDYPCIETTSTTAAHLATLQTTPLLTTSLPCPPPVPATHCLPLNGTVTSAIPNCHPHFGHNEQAVSVTTIACVGAAENVNKPALPPVAGPGCGFTGSGHVGGWCGLSGGQVTGTLTFGGHPYNFSVHFTGVGGELVVVGHYTNPADGHHGLITGAVTAVPPTPTSGTSCIAKSARTFTIVGTVAGVPEPVL